MQGFNDTGGVSSNAAGPAPAPLSGLTQEEKTWAVLAHASILLSLLTAGLGGPIAAFVIWLVKKDQSAYVGRQALQSLVYQLVVDVLLFIMWGGIALLSMALVGLCCVPFGLIITIAPVVYGCYAAYACSLGRDFNYWLIGDMIRGWSPS